MFSKTHQKISSKLISLVFGILILCFALSFWVLAVWQEPTQTPPGGNVDTPLNVSSIGQDKEGGLWIHSNGAAAYSLRIGPTADDLVVTSGKVGIGTLDPGSFKLYVEGKIRAAPTEVADSADTVATKGYVDAANGGSGESVGVTMLSAMSGAQYFLAGAVNYCRDLNAVCAYMVDESTCPGDTFSDWRLPTLEELALFIGNPSNPNSLWTRTGDFGTDDRTNHWIGLILSNGSWNNTHCCTGDQYVRCVR